jgi:hypothetical protein
MILNNRFAGSDGSASLAHAHSLVDHQLPSPREATRNDVERYLDLEGGETQLPNDQRRRVAAELGRDEAEAVKNGLDDRLCDLQRQLALIEERRATEPQVIEKYVGTGRLPAFERFTVVFFLAGVLSIGLASVVTVSRIFQDADMAENSAEAVTMGLGGFALALLVKALAIFAHNGEARLQIARRLTLIGMVLFLLYAFGLVATFSDALDPTKGSKSTAGGLPGAELFTSQQESTRLNWKPLWVAVTLAFEGVVGGISFIVPGIVLQRRGRYVTKRSSAARHSDRASLDLVKQASEIETLRNRLLGRISSIDQLGNLQAEAAARLLHQATRARDARRNRDRLRRERRQVHAELEQAEADCLVFEHDASSTQRHLFSSNGSLAN